MNYASLDNLSSRFRLAALYLSAWRFQNSRLYSVVAISRCFVQ
jgi:hypothetical protein